MGLDDIINEGEIEMEVCSHESCGEDALVYLECATPDKEGFDRGFYCKRHAAIKIKSYNYTGVDL